MRVLLITDAFPPEVRSSSHLMYELAEDLAHRGHAITALTCHPRYNLAQPLSGLPRKGEAAEKLNGIEVLRVSAPAHHEVGHWRRGLGQTALPLVFNAAARSLPRHDVVYTYSPPLTLGLVSHWLARRWRAPFVLNVQDLFPQNAIDLGALRSSALIALLQRLESYLYRRAAAVAVHSPGNAAWVAARGAAGKVRVIHNWVDTGLHAPQALPSNSFRLRLGLTDRFVVLFAGVMGYAQDMRTIVEAAAQLADQRRIVFLLVGDGSERPGVERRVRELGLQNVRLLPFVSRQDYPALLASCNAGLVTLKKTMKTPVVPSKLATYMAAGRPVVLSVNQESDARAVVQQAGCGVLVPAGDAGALAAAVRRLAENPEGTAAFGVRGRHYALQHFSRAACIDQVERLLQELTAAGGD